MVDFLPVEAALLTGVVITLLTAALIESKHRPCTDMSFTWASSSCPTVLLEAAVEKANLPTNANENENNELHDVFQYYQTNQSSFCSYLPEDGTFAITRADS